MDLNDFISCAKEKGASNAAVIRVDQILFDPELRKYCAMDTCGAYNKNWTCPPCVGEINELIAKMKQFHYALVIQTIGNLEDSFDFEGMQERKAEHTCLSHSLYQAMKKLEPVPFMLCAGGCTVCERCAKADDLPCRHPEEAFSSLEAYGINVSHLAKACGMNYINGQNTVTYFSAYFI